MKKVIFYIILMFVLLVILAMVICSKFFTGYDPDSDLGDMPDTSQAQVMPSVKSVSDAELSDAMVAIGGTDYDYTISGIQDYGAGHSRRFGFFGASSSMTLALSRPIVSGEVIRFDFSNLIHQSYGLIVTAQNGYVLFNEVESGACFDMPYTMTYEGDELISTISISVQAGSSDVFGESSTIKLSYAAVTVFVVDDPYIAGWLEGYYAANAELASDPIYSAETLTLHVSESPVDCCYLYLDVCLTQSVSLLFSWDTISPEISSGTISFSYTVMSNITQDFSGFSFPVDGNNAVVLFPFKSAAESVGTLRMFFNHEDPAATITFTDFTVSIYEGDGNVQYDAGYNDGYETGYHDGFAEGQDYGYDFGYDAGYDVGYDIGDAAGYTRGHAEGYNEGYDYCLEYGFTDASGLALVKNAFLSIFDAFSIKIFGYFSIGDVVGIVVIISVVFFIFKLVRG